MVKCSYIINDFILKPTKRFENCSFCNGFGANSNLKWKGLNIMSNTKLRIELDQHILEINLADTVLTGHYYSVLLHLRQTLQWSGNPYSWAWPLRGRHSFVFGWLKLHRLSCLLLARLCVHPTTGVWHQCMFWTLYMLHIQYELFIFLIIIANIFFTSVQFPWTDPGNCMKCSENYLINYLLTRLT